MTLTFVRGLAGSAAIGIFIAGCAGSSTLGTGPSQSSQGFSPQRVPAGYHLVAGPAVSGPIMVRDLPRVPQPGYIKYATKRTLYVADTQKNQVLLFNPSKAKPTPIGSITSGRERASRLGGR